MEASLGPIKPRLPADAGPPCVPMLTLRAGRYRVKAQGWYRDPYGIHDDRYFSDGQPTKLVRDGSAESYDPSRLARRRRSLSK
jgi:hypothetical protein